MPHQRITLTGGANVHETPALNQTGISASNEIRIKQDVNGMILVEKMGGWAKFYSTKITSPVVELLGWQDTNLNKWIAYATSSSTHAQLAAIQCLTNSSGITTASSATAFYDLTPTYYSVSVPSNLQTTAGSPTVIVTDDVVLPVNYYDTVFFSTQVCVGGLVLSGHYPCLLVAPNQYSITAVDIFGNPLNAAYTTVAAAITLTGASYSVGPPVTLTLTWATPNYTFIAGEFVNVKGINPQDWNGSWIVQSSTATSVVLLAPSVTSTTYVSGGTINNYGTVPVISTTYSSTGNNTITVTMADHGYSVGSTFPILNQVNCGGIILFGNYIVQTVPNSYTFTINAGSSALNTSLSYLNSLTVIAGTGTGSAVTLTFGDSSYSIPNITITGGSSTISAVTLTWTSPQYTFVVGQSIIVSGIVTPSAWNGTYTVTSSTATSVTYSLSGAATSWGSGGIVYMAPFNVGAMIQVSGCTPTAWNGNYVVTAVTAFTVTYNNSTAGTISIGGTISDIGGDLDLVYILGQVPAYTAYGYGFGNYGSGNYNQGSGATSSITGNKINASNWSLGNWGQVLVACQVGFSPISFSSPAYLAYQPIFIWDPTSNLSYPTVLTAGPISSNGILVAMPQRQIIAWGSSFSGLVDPLLVRWCDINNYNTWVAQITNQAGSFRLSTGSAIIGARQVSQQTLLWTDVGLWVMQYIGQPYVYSFNQVGFGCGLIGRHASGVMNGTAYWMGPKGFFMLSGEGVVPVTCPVWDYIFQEIDQSNVSVIVCAVNSMFQEISWYFPTTSSVGVPSMYVKYNATSNTWDIGTLSRTAWIDNGILGPPIGYDPVNQYIYQHEISPDADGVAMTPSFTTGYAALGDGDAKTFVDQIWPDFKWGYYGGSNSASVSITFNVTDYPDQAPATYGPYTMNSGVSYVTPRLRGRLISYTVSGNDLGSFWRLGALRYRYQVDGKI